MPKMEPSELQAILTAERTDADASSNLSELSDKRTRALEYYQGDMSGDMPAITGRSSAVSTDVADTIEGLMAPLMEIMVATDEVIEFDPVGPDDEELAQQESDYCNHIFMQKNDGFKVIYSFMKDALLEGDGIVKVFWEETEKEERETYHDIGDDELALLASDPEIEIIEHTVHEPEIEQQSPSLPPMGPMQGPGPMMPGGMNVPA